MLGKEVLVDLRRCSYYCQLSPVDTEMVTSYLGIHLSNKLDWTHHFIRKVRADHLLGQPHHSSYQEVAGQMKQEGQL